VKILINQSLNPVHVDERVVELVTMFLLYIVIAHEESHLVALIAVVVFVVPQEKRHSGVVADDGRRGLEELSFLSNLLGDGKASH